MAADDSVNPLPRNVGDDDDPFEPHPQREELAGEPAGVGLLHLAGEDLVPHHQDRGGTLGLHTTIWIGAIGAFFAFVPLLFSPLRSLRTMPDPVMDTPAVETIGEAVDESPRPLPSVPHPALQDVTE